MRVLAAAEHSLDEDVLVIVDDPSVPIHIIRSRRKISFLGYLPTMRSVDLQQSFADCPPSESRSIHQIASCTDSTILNEVMSGMIPTPPVLLRYTIDCGWNHVNSAPSDGPVGNTLEPNYRDSRYQMHEDLRSYSPVTVILL